MAPHPSCRKCGHDLSEHVASTQPGDSRVPCHAGGCKCPDFVHFILSEHKSAVIRLYLEDGWSMQAIGSKYGKSREAVRQFLNDLRESEPDLPWPESGRGYRQGLRDKIREREAEEALALLKENAPPCVVCGDPVLRRTGGSGENKTCCTEHSVLWSKARYILDPTLRKRQRQSMARSVIKHPDSHTPGAHTWAQNELAGLIPESNGNHPTFKPDSKAGRAYEEVMRIRAKKGWAPQKVEAS